MNHYSKLIKQAAALDTHTHTLTKTAGKAGAILGLLAGGAGLASVPWVYKTSMETAKRKSAEEAAALEDVNRQMRAQQADAAVQVFRNMPKTRQMADRELTAKLILGAGGGVVGGGLGLGAGALFRASPLVKTLLALGGAGAGTATGVALAPHIANMLGEGEIRNYYNNMSKSQEEQA